MAKQRRRHPQPGVSAEGRETALEKARILTSYMLCAKVDDARRCEVKSMEPSELREVVAADPGHPLARSIGESLDVVEGRRLASVFWGPGVSAHA